MDNIERIFYVFKYHQDVLLSLGIAYQTLFEKIMVERHGKDFVKIKPWGAAGDWKADGYLQSTKTVFQVYAPHELKVSDTLKKIDEDFVGALNKWGKNMRCWTFVHNSYEGIPPAILSKIQTLKEQYNNISFELLDPDGLQKILFDLKDAFLESLYGYSPTRNDLTGVTASNIKNVIDAISRENGNSNKEMTPVSSRKLHVNNLSHDVKSLIKVGLTKSEAVNIYFSRNYNPKLGDEIASTFKKKYDELKETGLPPDNIFAALQQFISGEHIKEPRDQVAALAVLTYLFERCDIFENNPGDAQ